MRYMVNSSVSLTVKITRELIQQGLFKMVTGGKRTLVSLSEKGSDFVFELSCSPCEKEGNTIEAINFCVNCSQYFCLACTKDHQTVKATFGHIIVYRTLAKHVGGAQKSLGLLPNEVCREHDGEKITTYCADHDLVLCNTCVYFDHRLCRGLSYIPKVADGSKTSKDIQQVQKEISESLEAIPQTKLYLKNLLTIAGEEKGEHLKRIRDCTERLIKHARDLEKSAVVDVNGCYKTMTDTLRSEIRSLDDAEVTMKDRFKHLGKVKVNSESQVFVDIKLGRQEVENVRQLKPKLTSAPTGKVLPEFVVRGDVEYFLNEVRCLGQYVEKKAYNAALYGEYDVNMSGDEDVCLITDSWELPDGTILIAGYNNSCIKKLDKSYKTIESLNMPPSPCGICQTGEDEVAVTLTDERKVQFVNVRGMLKITRSFTVSECCRGIMISRGELFVSCGGHSGDENYAAEGPGFVDVYSMSGSLLRKIQLDHRGQQIFSLPHHMTATDNGNKINIADDHCGVITVDRQGNVLSTFFRGLLGTIGVCAVTDDNLLVCGYSLSNVLQISAYGEMVDHMLGAGDGVKKPLSLLFLRGSSRLILTEDNSNKIKVFNLKL